MPLGTPIIASCKGKIIFVKHDSDRYIRNISEMETMSMEELIGFAAKYTNFVCIYHNDDTFTEYVHLDSRSVVAEGQEVEQSQVIGYCGISGLTTEPHLHFNRFKVVEEKVVSIPVEFSDM